MRNNGQAVEVPACQSERNEAFTRAVRAGDAKTAAALVRAEPPEDATEAERERWRKRRRLYRRAGLLAGEDVAIGANPGTG